MKEWICEEVPAVTVDGKVVSTLLHQEQELVRCKDCKYGEPWGVLIGCGTTKGFGIAHEPDWFCADGVNKDE